jgi:hypothetical protein
VTTAADLAACYALSAGVDEDVYAPINSFGRGNFAMDQVESNTNLYSPSVRPTEAGLAAARSERRSRLTPTGLAPLASLAYRYLFVGTALTMAGYFMQVVAQGWLIYDLTGSSTWLGFVSFASGIPLLVLALPAGV